MKKSTLLSLSILFTFSIFSQNPEFNWAAGFGNYSGEFTSAVASDDSGYAYAVGDFEQTVDFDPDTTVYNLTSNGTRDIFILKLDAFGNLIWAHNIGGVLGELCGDMTIDASGNIFVTGRFEHTVDFDPDTASTYNLTSAGADDAFILKLNKNGIFQWARKLGSTSSEGGDAICLDPSGNIIVTGYQTGTSDLDPGSSTHNVVSKGGKDVFIVKLNPSGNFIWGKNIGGTSTDEVQDINSDASGNIYLTGAFVGSADFDPHPTATDYRLSAGSADYFVLKLGSNGNQIWAHTFGKFGADETNAVITDSKGVYVAGYFRGTVDFDPDTTTYNVSSISGSADPFIQKFDTSGDFKWVRVYAGSGNSGINAAQIGYSGNLYITGSFVGTADFDPDTSTYNLTSTTSGASDVFVQNMDTSGNMIWTVSYGSTAYDHGTAITTNRFGNIITGGAFTYTVDFDPDTSTYNLTSFSFHPDAFVQSLKECLNDHTFDTIISCKSSFTWLDSVTYTESTDTPMVVLTNFRGCDSIVSLSLSLQPINYTDSIQSCTAVTWIDSVTYVESNDTAQFVITDSMGCDSVITLNLTILSTQVVDEINACEPFTWIDSVTYSNSTDTPMVIFTDSHGCDSVVTLDLTITRPNVDVVVQGNTLNAQATSSVFQWLDCNDNFSEIPGAHGNIFTPQSNGLYAVEVLKKGCADTSLCYQITGIGIADYSADKIRIYPNPGNGFVNIEFDENTNATINIYSSQGSLVKTEKVISQKSTTLLLSIDAGIYYLEVLSEKGLVRKKIIIE